MYSHNMHGPRRGNNHINRGTRGGRGRRDHTNNNNNYANNNNIYNNNYANDNNNNYNNYVNNNLDNNNNIINNNQNYNINSNNSHSSIHHNHRGGNKRYGKYKRGFRSNENNYNNTKNNSGGEAIEYNGENILNNNNNMNNNNSNTNNTNYINSTYSVSNSNISNEQSNYYNNKSSNYSAANSQNFNNNTNNAQNYQKKSSKSTNIPKNKNPHLSLSFLRSMFEKPLSGDFFKFFQKEDFPKQMENTKFHTQGIYLFTKILLKICDSGAEMANSALSRVIRETTFLNKALEFSKENVGKLVENYVNGNEGVAENDKKNNNKYELVEFFSDFVKANRRILEKFENIEGRIMPEKFDFVIGMLKRTGKDIVNEVLKSKINDIIKSYENWKEIEEDKMYKLMKEKKSNNFNNQSKNMKAIDYKNRNVIITNEELMNPQNINIRPHIKQGGFESYEQYIDTMFYLMYEDCYRSLKKSIILLKSSGVSFKNDNYNSRNAIYELSRTLRDVYLYTNVSIKSISIDHEGFILTLDFTLPNKGKASFSKRMMLGSLIVLFDENYGEFLICTIHYNPYILSRIKDPRFSKARFHLPSPPFFRVQVKVITPCSASLNFVLKYRSMRLAAIENKAYFEAYVHVLRRLHQAAPMELPFADELVAGKKEGRPPLWLQRRNQLIYNNYYLNPSRVEYSDNLIKQLDVSQLKALHKCLNNRVALIQGPPGTGKTHTSVILADILYQNLKQGEQILVVCYTNHALDQFLESIAKKIKNPEENIVRIGGRCKNEYIKNFVLKPAIHDRRIFDKRRDMDKIGEELKDILALLNKNTRINSYFMSLYYKDIYHKIEDDFFTKMKLKRKDVYYYYAFSKDKSIKHTHHNRINDICKNICKNVYHKWSMCKKDELKELARNLLCECNYTEKDIKKAINNLNSFGDENEDLMLKLKNFGKDINHQLVEYQDPNQVPNQNREQAPEEEEEVDEEDEEEALLEYEDRLNLNNMDALSEKDKKSENEDEVYNEEGEEEGFEMTWDIMNYLKDNVNYFDIGPKITKIMSDFLKDEIIKSNNPDISPIARYEIIHKEERELLQLNDALQIRQKKIVAMTTSGCAKNATMLESCNFVSIIVEEAAEVLEPHILSLLTRKTQHLIMIGDHKQLKPKPYNFELERKMNFDVSMFERLVNNSYSGFSSLKNQRRMRPVFADFVRLIYGDSNYIDYHDTKNKERVRGMTSNMLFLNHTFPEDNDNSLMSKANKFEANYLVRLAEYLMKQGYKSDQITILTFYVGQVLLIRNLIKKGNKGSLKDIRVTSVDNYQGEECDIILLSLVRSNSKNEIGFLRSFNRVCVSFSRAKLGFYVIGNIDCLVKGEKFLRERKKRGRVMENGNINSEESKMEDVWERIYAKLKEKNIISDSLVIKCENHGTENIIKKPEDFNLYPEGGCQKQCSIRMACGHICEKSCHFIPLQSRHDDLVQCSKTCQNTLKCGHKCQELCFICKRNGICGLCKTILKEAILPCGHTKKNVRCGDDRNNIKCDEKCQRALKCGHQCPNKCSECCGPCQTLVKTLLPCGHYQNIKCGSDRYLFICKEKCKATLKCGHACSGTCGECLNGTLHKKCQKKCGKALFCGHICKMNCASQCLCNEKCINICTHGYCDDKCCELCPPCKEKCALGCRHSKCTKLCGELCERTPCDFRCEKNNKCGHQCMGLCGERCPEICKICDPNNDSFQIMFGREQEEDALFYKLKCGHIFEYRDLDQFIQIKSNQIKMFTCPSCQQILLDEPRYQNKIKEAFNECSSLKKLYLERISGIRNEYFEKSKDIISDVEKQLNDNRIRVFESMNDNIYSSATIKYTKYLPMKDHLPYTMKCIAKFKENEKKIQVKYITTYNLLTLLNKFMGIEYFAGEINDSNKTNDAISYIKNYDIIKEYFIDFSEFNVHFFRNLKMKIDNMLYYALAILYEKGNQDPYAQNNYMAYNMNYLSGYNRIGNVNDDLFAKKQLLQKIGINKTKIISSNFLNENVNLEDFKIKNIMKEYELLKNLGSAWYKCPNGHIYAVGECGGPMQTSTCPECHARIGGENHVPAANNNRVDINEVFQAQRNNSINSINNADEQALNNMINQNNENNNHHMDDDIRELLRQHPEMNMYN